MKSDKLLAWITISLAVFITTQSAAQSGNRVLEYIPPIELDEWEYRWGDSPFSEEGIPHWTRGSDVDFWYHTDRLVNPEGDSQDYLWFRSRLPDVLPEGHMIAIRFIWMNAEMYVDSTRFYRSGKMEYDYGSRFNGYAFHIVNLPPDAGGKMLYVRVVSGFNNVIGVKPDQLFIGEENSLLRYAIRQNILAFVIGVVIANIGLVSFLLLLVGKRDRESRLLLLYFGLSAFCYGINYVCSHVLSYMLIQSPAILYFLTSIFFLFPVGLLGLFESIVGIGKGGIIKWLKHIHLATWVIALGLDIFGFVPYFTWSSIVFGLLAISMAAMVVSVIPAIRKQSMEARVFGIAMIITAVPGFFDTIYHGILARTDLPALSPWGILFFIVILLYLLDMRFSRNSNQLRTAHKQLETYSHSLEERVQDRTEELSRKNKKLQVALDELKEMQQQLVQSEKMASLGQLTAGIAHEIKNPLNFVNNFATLSIELADELNEALKKGEDIELILEDLKMNAANITKHGQRADRIVRSMMEHARGGNRELQMVKLNDLVEEYVNLAFHGMRAQKEAINVSIVRSYDDQVGDVLMVPQEIGRVVINLCSNAFDAMREKRMVSDTQYVPKLQVVTQCSGKFAEVYVKDNGCGVSDAQKERIFEPFFTTKPAGAGTGLGLSISYDIVVAGHKGEFEVASTSQEGTEFVIRLPQKPDQPMY